VRPVLAFSDAIALSTDSFVRALMMTSAPSLRSASAVA
jgi:hypothetical protein